MRVIVSTDEQFDWGESDVMRAIVDRWTAGDLSVIMLNKHMHAVAEQPDGTWLRICHPDRDESVAVPHA